MALSFEAIHAILGIKEKMPTTPAEMAKKVRVTFFPHAKGNVSGEVKKFANELEATLRQLGVEILPYEKALSRFPTSKWVKWYTLATLNTGLGFVKRVLGKKHDTTGQDRKGQVLESYFWPMNWRS